MSGSAPLAERMRPRDLDELVGQRRLLAPGAALRRALEAGRLHSMILWGPPGCGKTTLARLVAARAEARFLSISAVMAGLPEVRRVLGEAAGDFSRGVRTVLFVDEVHRFNKIQQDAFLPHIEAGHVVFIGATTENPSFELNSALLSRCRVHVLEPLATGDIVDALRRALLDAVRGLGALGLGVDDDALEAIAQAADGDLRRALTLLEIAADVATEGRIDAATLAQVLADRTRRFDRQGEQFYDQISALHKSVRSSDPDAAIYWLARMLDGGCDPAYLARRLTRMAVEDIGLADPDAQAICLRAWETYERLGSPEGELALAQAVAYLALAPKSNATYVAYKAAADLARRTGSEPPPRHILNAPTRLMKEQGFGAGYAYDHDQEDGFSGQDYFPEGMKRPVIYVPVDRGFERELKKRAAYFAGLRAKRQGNDKPG